MSRIDQAIMFAAEAHAGQTRKYDGLPYIFHPMEVMGLISEAPVNADEEMKIAALLHDVLEDTDVAHEEIVTRFGLGVYELVMELTDQFGPAPGMNRAQRKLKERERLWQVSNRAQTIKLADILSNTRGIAHLDPGFAPVYLEVVEELAKGLRDGNQTLRFRALDQIAAQKRVLYGPACSIRA